LTIVPMAVTEVLTTRVTPEIKQQVTDVVRGEFLTESIWLRRIVLRELRDAPSEGRARHRGDVQAAEVRGRCSGKRAPGSSLYVRLRPDDRLLLHERAAARGMASATYVSVLVRSHLRSRPPLPKDELVALKRAVAELGAVGRNLNQIARAANQGAHAGNTGRDDFRAILKICEALRDHTKELIKANTSSWASGHAEDDR
jgi:hypothetical protein